MEQLEAWNALHLAGGGAAAAKGNAMGVGDLLILEGKVGRTPCKTKLEAGVLLDPIKASGHLPRLGVAATSCGLIATSLLRHARRDRARRCPPCGGQRGADAAPGKGFEERLPDNPSFLSSSDPHL